MARQLNATIHNITWQLHVCRNVPNMWVGGEYTMLIEYPNIPNTPIWLLLLRFWCCNATQYVSKLSLSLFSTGTSISKVSAANQIQLHIMCKHQTILCNTNPPQHACILHTGNSLIVSCQLQICLHKLTVFPWCRRLVLCTSHNLETPATFTLCYVCVPSSNPGTSFTSACKQWWEKALLPHTECQTYRLRALGD